MLDPLAAGALEAEAAVDGDEAADEAGGGALDDDEPELHPTISAATAATATPPAAIRARLSLNMVLTRSLERKAFGARVHRCFGGLIDQ